MKIKTIGAVAILLILTGGYFGITIIKKLFTPQKTHYHAAFLVFENDRRKDFSDDQYIYIEPCSLNNKDNNKNIQLEKAHLHDNVGDVVHVERTGSVWGDLFTNLHYPINYKNASAYINGKRINNFQNQPIHAYDTLVVFVGNNNIAASLSETPSRKYIQAQERKSKDCGE